MEHGSLYQRANGVQRRDAQQTLADYAHLFRWRPDGRDSLLDIGCGSGDVTVDFLLPLMPGAFTRLVGADLSDGMLRHARQTYGDGGDGAGSAERLAFERLDVGAPLPSAWLARAPFDHITSFYCLHWVQDQRQALRNVWELLAPSGDCLLVLLAANPIFEVYRRLCRQRRWAPYMRDVAEYISPYQNSGRPAEEMGGRLLKAGFAEYSVQVLDRQFVYEGVEVLRKSVRAVSPFIDRMAPAEQEDFLDDYVACVRKMQLAVPGNGSSSSSISATTTQFRSPYKLLVAYARK